MISLKSFEILSLRPEIISIIGANFKNPLPSIGRNIIFNSLYNLYTKEEILNRLTLVKTVDDFDGQKSIGFMNVGNMGNHYLMMYYDDSDVIVGHEHIGISFGMVGYDPYLYIYSNIQELGLNKGDKIYFMFDTGNIEVFEFSERSTGRHPLGNECKISIEQLCEFAGKPLKKWRYECPRFKITADNSLICQISDIPNTECYQLLIQKMASGILNELLEVQHPFEDV